MVPIWIWELNITTFKIRLFCLIKILFRAQLSKLTVIIITIIKLLFYFILLILFWLYFILCFVMCLLYFTLFITCSFCVLFQCMWTMFVGWFCTKTWLTSNIAWFYLLRLSLHFVTLRNVDFFMCKLKMSIKQVDGNPPSEPDKNNFQ